MTMPISVFKVAALLFFVPFTLFSSSLGGDTLTPTQHLTDNGDILISAASSFALGFFSPNSSANRYIGIWYHNISLQTIVWVANRQHPIAGSSGRLSITTNGTLVIADNSTVIWSTFSAAFANPIARLLDNGNFVVVEANDNSNNFAWESFNFPTDTLLPGMKIGWNLTSGTNHNLTAWLGDDDPSPGGYVTGVDFRGDPQIFIWSGTRQYWRGGPWNGLRFSGIPQMKLDMVGCDFVVDSDAVFWSYYIRDFSLLQRVVATSSGHFEHQVWIGKRKSWEAVGFVPRDECDTISPCGPNGICYPTREPMCTCMQGFRPENTKSWDLSDWTDGCVRKTELDCHNRTDFGFFTQSNMKLPDTSRSTVDWSMSLENCRALCSANCSCTAYASANTSGSGSGCIVWTTELTDVKLYDSGIGQDLYIKLAASDLNSEEPDHSHQRRLVIIILVLVATIFLVACGACSIWIWKKRGRSNADEENDQVQDMDLPFYDLSTIVNATDDFSSDNKLGQGGFGPVYKGKLEDGIEIAVKRLSKTSEQGMEEFKNEALLIAKLQHRNLVRLLGCCIQGGERMLVYEYMPNGSLDAFLFGDETKSVLLDWPTRYNIITGISRGLLYLHQDSRLRIIHRDLKASNVLLDKDMNPKISDFGMARIFGGEDSEDNTRRVVGTYGYMSPEYAMHGIFSVKSDVFSLGVLILEIVTGKRNRGAYYYALNINMIEHVWNLWKEGKVLELIDASIGLIFPTAEVMSCIKIGLLCVQDRASDRPTMSSVVKMLGNDTSLLPEPLQPGFVISSSSSAVDSSSSKKESSYYNTATTALKG
ncbi:receptor-like serine/threonine-protein kinase SD1-8 isoform X3 [Canna indica]|uniref:Receptor-like serine/threonine-protein kinase n=1 Tax=Canna indica TaxID=4628 RepID=A0AAQ3QCX2_9LILI|nr:receptor-like serine/threonine-protein kinase SD1-8 isoform X3 [Canna indica]